jgi:hypothetical protein
MTSLNTHTTGEIFRHVSIQVYLLQGEKMSDLKNQLLVGKPLFTGSFVCSSYGVDIT